NITLVVHDWGGAIGFGYAVNHPQNVQKIVVLNSAAFYDSALPKRIALCRGVLGKFLVQRLNLFARAALYMTTTKKLSKESKKEYLRPYRSVASRIGIYSFLQDIPVKPDHATRHLLDSIESRLPEIRSQLLILWGKKDFCFTEHFYHRWKTFFPAARSVLYETAGHLVTEDASDEVLREIREFVQ
ncbi:MAG: alpha/beta fold hydrolase, partial [Coriobacteriia bacterium]|nr:alpha/beta fold hydrolase [Coriobacteriia bacterium]